MINNKKKMLICILSSVVLLVSGCQSSENSKQSGQSLDISRVEHENGYVEYVINQNNIFPEDKWDEVHAFNTDRVVAVKENKIGLFDSSGRELLKPIYDHISAILDNNDNIIVYRIANSSGMMGIMDSNLQVVVDFEWENIQTIGLNENEKCENLDDLYFIVRRNDTYGLMNKDGKLVADPIWQDIDEVGSQFIVKQNDRYGLMNKDGKLVADLIWQEIKEADSRFIVKLNDRYGIMNKTGEVILDPHYKRITLLRDENGEAIQYLYERENGLYGIMNLEFEPVLDHEYTELECIYDPQQSSHSIGYLYKENDLYGVMDEQFKVQVKPVWEKAHIRDGFLDVDYPGEYGTKIYSIAKDEIVFSSSDYYSIYTVHDNLMVLKPTFSYKVNGTSNQPVYIDDKYADGYLRKVGTAVAEQKFLIYDWIKHKIVKEIIHHKPYDELFSYDTNEMRVIDFDLTSLEHGFYIRSAMSKYDWDSSIKEYYLLYVESYFISYDGSTTINREYPSATDLLLRRNFPFALMSERSGILFVQELPHYGSDDEAYELFDAQSCRELTDEVVEADLYKSYEVNSERFTPAKGYPSGKLYHINMTTGTVARMDNVINWKPYQEGLAAVENEEHKWGYVDYGGNIVIDFQFTDAEPFSSSGTAHVISDYKNATIDKQGNIISDQ